MTDDAYDVFVSHSARDAAWVEAELLPNLKNHGLRVCTEAQSFKPGLPRITQIERAVERSRHTLLVLTPDYLSDASTEFETLLVATFDPANSERHLIPLLRAACDVPLRLRIYTALDFSQGEDWPRLLDALGLPDARLTPDDIPLETVPEPALLPPGSLMPLSRNEHFVGRRRELLELARLLRGGVAAAIQPPVAATGLGGIGKTQLACEFVYRYGQFFPGGVFWLSFENPDGVPSEIARCGGVGLLNLRPNFADLKLDDQLALVRQAWLLPTPRLLVFDNCEDEALLERWRPPAGGCRMLVTSRRADWSSTLAVQPLHLATLPRAESVALLRQHRPDLASDDADLDALADYLGDLPLALHVAGSFLQLYRADWTPAEYLDALRATDGLDEELLQAEDRSPTGHDQSIEQTFRLSYDRLDGSKLVDALALRLLYRAAHCAPGEPLPRELLLLTAGIDLDDKKATTRATKAIRRLHDLGLLERAADGAFRLHRLLAAFVRAVAQDDTAQADVEDTLFDITSRINKKGDPRPLLALQPLVRAVVDMARERDDQRVANLCNELGYHLDVIGDYAGARPYYERALTIFERVLGGEHPDTAASLNNLGLLLQTQGDYAGARPYYERALAIREVVLGAEHRDTARSLNNLGGLLKVQGDYAGARPYYERALTIREAVLGAEHPETAGSLNNLGGLLWTQGDDAGARPYFERALAIMEAVLGAEHPNTATSLNNLGLLLEAQGDLQGARPYLERALAILERVLGPDHPETCIVRDNLASLDTPPQSAEQQIAAIEQEAQAAVEATLAEGNAEQRAELAAEIERAAQQAEQGEEDGSPLLALAGRLRAIAKRLEATE